MQVEVKVPQLSESVSEATLVSWRKKAGEAVKRDENLIDVETDKVVLELPAPADGVLVKIVKNDGDSVTSGEVIAVIDTEAKAAATSVAKPAEKEAAAPAKAGAQAAVPTPGPAATASPAAKKIAAEKGVDPASIPGTGRDGRVTKADAMGAGSEAKAPASPSPVPPSPSPSPAPGARTEQRVPMSRLRQRIAERLVQSQSTAAILTTFNEVNMAPVMELRARYKDRFEKEHGVKLGFMSFFVKAAVHALRKYPVVNASIDGTDIVYHGFYDIGIAVGSERGLVVPILRNADQMSIAQIEAQIADFGKRAKDGKITLEELTGGTFSISNGGVFGSMLSTPIINPPQSAILGVHATKERPVVENGQVVIRPMNYLALSYDHRIIDGREAVLSLVAMKEALEDPARILLDL
ncbi:MAG TPA: 2-oxoglutarate dehydrogenase complex dihydrolipoyllysine-residue succinyltransferase [Usitatibacter sp.]|nr:2-oxoglutarate dehydrogenase complex dihydrolipoyllysine-residue succinyltransferase [Usitatibacter sp.]